MQPLYSGGYGLYAYAVLDSAGRVLFSSRNDGARAVLARRIEPSATGSMRRRSTGSVLFGVSVARPVGQRMYWIQVGQDLSHRDVIIDDVVALVLPARRLDHLPDPAGAAPDRHPDLPPRARAGARGVDHGGGDRAGAHRRAPARAGDAGRDRAAGSRRQPGVRPSRGGLPRPARLHRRHGARAAHAACHHARPSRCRWSPGRCATRCAPISST